MVEDSGGRQAQAGGGPEPVAQFDRGERVEAELLEGLGGIDLGRRVVAEDGGGVGADEGEDVALPRHLVHRSQSSNERPRDSGPPPGHLRHPRRHRHRVSGGHNRIEERQPLLLAQGQQARALDPRPVGVAESGTHAVLQAPGTPGDRGGRQSLCLSLAGKRLEEGIGGGVVALAWAAESGGDRGEEDEGGELQILAELVQVPGGVGLGGEDPGDALCVKRLDRAVVEHPGGVDDCAERVLGID